MFNNLFLPSPSSSSSSSTNCTSSILDNNSSICPTDDNEQYYCGSTIWLIINIVTILITINGNLLTILAILFSRKLNSFIANQFIFSLAVSDLFVGFTIPYHMAFYIVENFGGNKLICLTRFVLISFACSSSIFNLLFIATDRYIAVVYPLHYTRLITRKSSLAIIIFGWCLSFSIAIIPLIWNDWNSSGDIKCELVEVLPNNYINFIVCPMFVLIWIMLLMFYTRICNEATGQAKRIRRKNGSNNQNGFALKESKSFQVMLTILGCFTFCWLPYFVIILWARGDKKANSALFYEIAFNLAMANSSMNPLVYAWKNTSFRKTFLTLLRCKLPNNNSNNKQKHNNRIPSGHLHYITNHDSSIKNSSSIYGEGAVDETFEMQCNDPTRKT